MFRDLKPLDRERHRGLRLSPNQPYRFAASELLVSLVAAEMAQVAREYPIVFPLNAAGMPAALFGVTPGANLHVNAQGQWMGRYIPAAIRRYPFQLMAHEKTDDSSAETRFTILIDESAPHLSERVGEPLFTDTGEPSPTLLRVQQVLIALEQDRRRTGELVAQLDQAGLLFEQEISVRPAGQEPHQLTGLRVANRARLNELAPDTLYALMQSGALELFYAHVLSLTNLQDGWIAKQAAAAHTDLNALLASDTISFNFH